MKFGFATNFSTAPDSVDYQMLSNIKDAGYDYWEPSVSKIAQLPEIEIGKLAEYLHNIGLPAATGCALFPGTLNIFTDGFHSVEAYLCGVFPRLVRLGCRQVGFGSPKSRALPAGMSYQAGFDIVSYLLHELVLPLLEEYDMKLMIEPLGPAECNFINKLDEGYALMLTAKSPRVGLLADTMHIIGSGDTPGDFLYHLSHIGHIHISEKDRLLPDVGYSPDCDALISAVKKSVYNGTISFETKAGDLKGALALLKDKL
jgi:sugar phosphate isomerase/epimerase